MEVAEEEEAMILTAEEEVVGAVGMPNGSLLLRPASPTRMLSA